MKIQFKFSLLLLVLLFVLQTASYAATITWTGNTSTVWNDVSNWSGGVPTVGDDVIIPSGLSTYPILTISVSIQSMVVESGATMTINNSGRLSISGASGDGIDNSGIFNNSGNITIEDTGDSGIFNNSGASFTNDGVIDVGTNNLPTGTAGILNNGVGTQFQNNGTINIERASGVALQNNFSAQFTNVMGAIIDIGQNNGQIDRDGITNNSGIGSTTNFTNSGTIIIDNFALDGLDNQDDFNNTSTGTISIGQNTGNIVSTGLRNSGNSAAFTNSGTITIDNASLQNQSDFNNTVNGIINIGQNGGTSSSNGISNIASTASFLNSGTVNVDNTVSDGLQNSGDFNNAATATLRIGQSGGNIGQEGIQNSGTASTFTNEGVVQIDGTASSGLLNEGTFNNQNSGRIGIGLVASIDSTGILNTGKFSQTGDTIKISNTAANGIDNRDTLTNVGVLVIDNTSGRGILNIDSGVFTNDSIINIDHTAIDGIDNQSTFNNNTNATINIGQNAGNIGRLGILNTTNTAAFTNSGTISIDNTSSDGIQNQGTFNNTATAALNIGQNAGNIGRLGIFNIVSTSTAVFTNEGTIAIDNTPSDGIQNQGELNNAASANLNIGQNAGNVGRFGLFNVSSDAFFNNAGTLAIDNTINNAIQNQEAASFDNTTAANVNIGQNAGNIGANGISNANGALSFTNSGTITIDNIALIGIFNLDTLHNAASGLLKIGQNDGNIATDGIQNAFNISVFTNDGSILIDSTGTKGLMNVGTFSNQNNGSIQIGGLASIGTTGLFNAGLFNQTGDTIKIANTVVYGIQNQAALNNEGVITIEHTMDNGIQNHFNGVFTNSGTISLDNIERRGIQNESDFINTATATLNIGQNGGNIGNNGIFNLVDTPTFTNSGIINIDNTANRAIENGDIFNNTAGAIINIGQNDGNIDNIGLINLTSSAFFTNSGIINVDNTSGSGIDNQADFSNAATANINIGQNGGNIGEDGIDNRGSAATFTNSGTIAIDNTSSSGIDNEGDFSNVVNATLDIGQNDGNIGGIGIFNQATFTNSSIINVDNTFRGITNTGQFDNAANAHLNIGQNSGNIDVDGIFNSGSSSSFRNNGTIVIDNTSSNGIRNRGDFSNAINATIDIGQNDGNIGQNGIFNPSNAILFTNSGTINIDNIELSGIENRSDFSNTTNGSLKIGQNSGNVVGDGLLTEGGSASFTNSGTIEIENPTTIGRGGIVLRDGAQFTDTAGIIRLGLNQAFSRSAFNLGLGMFTGNGSTMIQCVGDLFIGAGSTVSGIGQLELEGDWINDGTFTTDSSVVTILGTSQSVIGGNSATTFFDLTINNSGNVVLENDVTVTRQLSLEAGQVNLGDNDFTLGDDYELVTQIGTSALVTDGTGEVISNIANGASQIFPVGNSNYTPITIQNDGTSDEFSVQCLAEVLENGTNGSAFGTNLVNTTWRIEEATAGGTDATLTAQWTSADELAGFDRNNAFLSRYDGIDWDTDATMSASGSDPYTITRSNVTEFSPFAVGTIFEGGLDCFGSDLVLTNETLVSGTYSTQQSIESTNLIEASSTVDFIAANVIELKAGFHAENGSIFSAVIDDCALTAADNEAIEQRTDNVAESIERTTFPLLFPNPVGQQLNIRDGIGQAVIYNMLGQEIQAFEVIDDLHTLDVSSLQSGQYMLLILRANGESVTLAFIK